MSKILDYVVITSSKGVVNLESLIKENINLGWQPIGGVAIMSSNVDSEDSTVKQVLVQAMVRYDD
ncbi:MAG: hypothetical protein ABI863_18030 [Ginsengibacter sp.]